MARLIAILILVLIAFSGIRFAHAEDCCKYCGCKMHCQLMCQWETCEVLRYKAEHEECPPPCCVCCDDRWIIGCPKPIKILKLKSNYEKKKRLVGQYVVRTCPHCDHQDSVPVPTPEKSK